MQRVQRGYGRLMMTDAPIGRSLPANGGGPRAALRALEALKALARVPGGLSLAELSKSLDVPKSSLFELMRALQAGGYIVNDRGHYQLGHGSVHLANLLGARDHVAAAARPYLAKLAVETAECAALVELHGDRHVIFVDQVESPRSPDMRIVRDALVPINCSSGGLAIMAMRPEAERDAYARSGHAEPYTDDTIHGEAGVRAAFAQVRETGVAVTRNSLLPGATGVAAPIFDMDGWACASIGVIGPNERVENGLDMLAQAVVAAARELSAELGHAGGAGGRMRAV